MMITVEGSIFEFPDDVTKEELITFFASLKEPPAPKETETPLQNVVTPEEVPAIGNEQNAFELGFVAGEEVVDEQGVRFKVDKYGRFIEL